MNSGAATDPQSTNRLDLLCDAKSGTFILATGDSFEPRSPSRLEAIPPALSEKKATLCDDTMQPITIT